ncbi:MAG: M20 metallopeptidase family protein, partial [Fusobacterium sp.]
QGKENKGQEKSIAIRADMDALPVTERVDIPFASKVKSTYNDIDVGVMHACGHDGHTTNLLYTAKWLQEQIKNGKTLNKSIMLIFQAAEEGRGGAQVVAQSEFFQSKKFEGLFALHVAPDIDQGKIGCICGPISFQNINFDIRIIGKGTHGAQPHKGIDSIYIGAKLIEAYQLLVAREIDPIEPMVLTIGSFKAGEVRNVIPEKVEILGTIRFANTGLIDFLEKRVKEINAGFEKAYGIKIEMMFKAFYPPVINEKKFFDILKEIIPKEKFVDNSRLTGSEDFSFYLQEGNKGLLFLLGIKTEKFNSALHTPTFDMDPRALKLGFKIFKEIMLKLEVFK